MTKHLPAIFLLLFSVASATAQLKIDPAYALMINDSAFTNGSDGFFVSLDYVRIKEISSGKVCAITSAEWTFMIANEVFHVNKAEEIKTHLTRARPKDKIFIEKIKLSSGCFIPPKQISFQVK